MEFRLVALDLDGTVLTSAHEPHHEAGEAIRDLQAAGVEVVLASGRNAPSMRAIANLMRVNCPLISSNGAVLQTAEGRVLRREHLVAETVRRAVNYALEVGCHLNADDVDEVVALEATEHLVSFQRRAFVSVRAVGREGILSLQPVKVLFIDAPERIPGHRSRLTAELAPGGGDLVSTERHYLEIVPSGVDKSHALAELAAHLGVDQAQIAALGDYENDLGMIRWAGLGVAMGNALPEVREAADRIVAGNDEGGAVEFLRSIV